MRLKRLYSIKWQLLSPLEDKDGVEVCPLEEQLENVAANMRKSAHGLLDMLAKCAAHGTTIFPVGICHEVCSENKIFQFTKGDLRLLWFYGPGDKIILLSHICVKKGQKTKQAEKDIAIALRNLYFEAVENKNIEVIDPPAGDEDE